MKKMFIVAILATIVCVFLLLLYGGQVTFAQFPIQPELACPSGYQPMPGGQTFNPSTGKFRQWLCVDINGHVLMQPNTNAPTQNIFYVSPNCGTQTNCFTVKDDGFQDVTCNWANSSTVVNCTDAPFTPAMVGRTIAGYNTCQTDAAAGAYINNLGNTGATITSFISATQITISNATTGAQASAGCIFVASIDDAALSAVDSAAQASPTCPKIELPAGIMGTLEPHFFTTPASCKSTSVYSGESNAAPLFEIDGQGSGVTTLWLPPQFDLPACVNGQGGHACMALDFARFHGWGITGGGLPNFPRGSGTLQYLLSTGQTTSFAYLDNFSCINAGIIKNGGSNVDGFTPFPFVTVITNSVFDGCGQITASGGNGSVFALLSSFQDSGSEGMNGITFISLGHNYFGGDFNSAPFAAAFDGGQVSLTTGDLIDRNFAPTTFRCFDTTAANQSFTMMNGAVCNAPSGIYIQNTGATITMFDSNLTTAGIVSTTGNPVTLLDQGKNTIPSFTGDPGNVHIFTTNVSGTPVSGHIATWTGTGGGLQDGGIASASSAQVSIAKNVGTALSAQTLIASVPATGQVFLHLAPIISTAGVGCSAASNNVTVTVAYTAPNGTASTIVFTSFIITGNGVLDEGSDSGSASEAENGIIAKAGTSVTYTTTSTLSSTGCSPIPQYTVYAKAVF